MYNRIKMYRAMKNYSQAELASKIGVSRVHISNLERNKSFPKLDMMIKIADALETKVEKIFIPQKD